jgi:glycosyltransferase involved in cell wall biosynthesis
MAAVLVTVSGTIPRDIETQVATGLRPQPDYLALGATLSADLLDYRRARRLTGRWGAWLERVGGPQLMLAWACFQLRGNYRLIFTDGEQIGIPLALLCKWGGSKGAKHFMIAHVLSVSKKMFFLDRFGLAAYIDRFFVYASWQKRFIETRWHVPSDRVVHTPFMVDSDFFAPAQVTPQPKRQLCAVGLELRDYPTLIAAVRDLDVEVVIAAASPWSKRADSTEGETLPSNVAVRKFTQYELRQLYADSCFMVMPIYDVNFQAGVTAILEAMAMGKAVICSRTMGQTDVIEEGVTGFYVPPGDVEALRAHIQFLLERPTLAAELGRAGRQRIEDEMNLAHYTKRLYRHVTTVIDQPAQAKFSQIHLTPAV